MRLIDTRLFLASTVLLVSCGSLTRSGTPQIAPRSLNIAGTYMLVDGFGNRTACIARIFWQDRAWRGWISTDHDTAEGCLWDGYRLFNMRMRGDRLLMSIGCPRSGCPSDIPHGTSYLMDVLPGVMLSGEVLRNRAPPRWLRIRLVQIAAK